MHYCLANVKKKTELCPQLLLHCKIRIFGADFDAFSHAILLDVTCCVRLNTLLQVVACCWELLRKLTLKQTKRKQTPVLFVQVPQRHLCIFFWHCRSTQIFRITGNLRTTATALSTTTGSELQCTAQARLVNFVVVVSSTTPNIVESRHPSAGKNPLF